MIKTRACGNLLADTRLLLNEPIGQLGLRFRVVKVFHQIVEFRVIVGLADTGCFVSVILLEAKPTRIRALPGNDRDK